MSKSETARIKYSETSGRYYVEDKHGRREYLTPKRIGKVTWKFIGKSER